jgi:hypothetical protein
MTRPYTPEELLERIIPHLDQRKLRRRVTKDGKQVQARCPFHDDDEPSLSLTLRNGELLAYCFNCGKVYDRLLELAGIDSATARPITPRRNAGRQPATAQAQPLTLAALANAKRLDAEKLIAWHVRELPDGGIEILYLTREGELHAVRYRLALEGANRFRWRKDDTPILYGLWRLPEWGDADTIYLCEGESDTWTLWHAGLAALGIPGASMWKPEWWRNLWEFGRIVNNPRRRQCGGRACGETCQHLPRPPAGAGVCAVPARRRQGRERTLAAAGRRRRGEDHAHIGGFVAGLIT